MVEIHNSFEDVEKALESYSGDLIVFEDNLPYTVKINDEKGKISYKIATNGYLILYDLPDSIYNSPEFKYRSDEFVTIYSGAFYRVRYIEFGKITYPLIPIIVNVKDK